MNSIVDNRYQRPYKRIMATVVQAPTYSNKYAGNNFPIETKSSSHE